MAVIGLVCSMFVYGAGRAAVRVYVGRESSAMRNRAEAEVRSTFDAAVRWLRQTASGVDIGSDVTLAAQDDAAAARRLFDAAGRALRQPPPSLAGDENSPEVAVTIYSARGEPIAWAGRPSELAPARIGGAEAWFFTRGDAGLRLVYVRPVLDGGARSGSIAAELALTPPGGVRPSPPEMVRVPSSVAPVSVYPAPANPLVRSGDIVFELPDPSGGRLLTAVIAEGDIGFAARRWQAVVRSMALLTLALSALLMVAPLLDWRNAARRASPYLTASLLVTASIVIARLLMRLASPADWMAAPLFSASAYASARLRPLLTSPFDFLSTALGFAAVMVLALYAVEQWRVAWRHTRRPLDRPARLVSYVLLQLAAGLALGELLLAYQGFLGDTLANTTLDLLHFSLHPWSSARVALQLGLVVWHATALGAAMLILRAASVAWRVPRHSWAARTATVACWAGSIAIVVMYRHQAAASTLPLALSATAAAVLALSATRFKARYRRGSQAFRLIALSVALVFPALAFYPTLFQLAGRSKTQLVETRFAAQAINQRETVKRLLQESLAQIDSVYGLAELVAPHADAPRTVDTDRAYEVWRTTSLAAPLTSSVELYGSSGTLLSRFAFNLPEDLSTVRRREEPSCAWDVFEEVSPFFAEERRILHAGRAICGADGRPLGSIVVHVMLDYADLPFISSQSPYVQLLRREDDTPAEGVSGQDIEYAVYGWSRTPLYASRATAWPLDDAAFGRAAESRLPFWTELGRGDRRYNVYLLNDRGGIHALGFPIVSPVEHLVNLAELTALAVITYVLLLLVSFLFGVLSRRSRTAAALFREVRASFYRKLFLAFVAAAVVPVLALALVTRAYVAGQIRESIESEAVRTAASARRVVEDLAAPRAEAEGGGVDDNVMVWVSRLIGEDVNVFTGPRLEATSERNLFASGLMPTRTPAEVYRDLSLQMRASTVTRERIGALEYIVAATLMTPGGVRTMLTVPLTSRQREIDSQIDTLDRRVLLAVLLFVLAGAGIGYSMAERIADPVNRLTRATRRIASGDLDARIVTTSSDELRRLVQDFNSMAGELQRQRAQLERTHRLEAWAEMARQVAHEIKNPLTPIQLNAEHLQRVHADRGEPMGPVLQECVDTILQQVTLLRQIASEFSNFASSPTASPTPIRVDELLREVLDPYRAGLGDRIRFDVDISPSLPAAYADRTLTARALTNVIENALHAMPGAGALKVSAWRQSTDGDAPQETLHVAISDTGAGMDPEALRRAFEPYFSTKARGTGLGLPIAKRNVELSGGTIAIRSERDRGTTVEISLPVDRRPA